MSYQQNDFYKQYDNQPQQKIQKISNQFPQEFEQPQKQSNKKTINKKNHSRQNDFNYDSPQKQQFNKTMNKFNKNSEGQNSLRSSSSHKKQPQALVNTGYTSKKHLMTINIEYKDKIHEFKIYPGETTNDLINKIFIRLKMKKRENIVDKLKRQIMLQLAQVKTRLIQKYEQKTGSTYQQQNENPVEVREFEQEQTIAVIKIEIMDQEMELIVKSNDDPQLLAEGFVVEHELSEQAVPVIRQKILDVIYN